MRAGRPERGTSLYDHPWYAKAFRAACAEAGITDYIRPYHDMRHTAITNLVADVPNVAILGTLAGHAEMKTTQRYIHLTQDDVPGARGLPLGALRAGRPERGQGLVSTDFLLTRDESGLT